MTKPPRKNDAAGGDDIERLVYEYLRKHSQMIPQTPEEVQAAEAWIAKNPVKIPQRLLNHKGGNSPPCDASNQVLRFPVTTSDATQGFARAAREGKTITPKIEEQMRKDREQKERENKRDS